MVGPMRDHRNPGWGHPGANTPGVEKCNARSGERARQDLLDSPAETMVFLRDILSCFFREADLCSF
jgi:hypothetical protein